MDAAIRARLEGTLQRKLGVDVKQAQALIAARLHTTKLARAASEEELDKVPGVGAATIGRIKREKA